MSSLMGVRAVVIGAGIGGLSAAGALARHFGEVVILERDRLSASIIGSRRGTPQDGHPHVLQVGGQQALDEIFPGFATTLSLAGAVPVRLSEDIQVERPDVGVLPRRDFGLTMLGASRPLIEWVLRRRVNSIANIVLCHPCRVTELMPATAGLAVRGVRFDTGSGASTTLEADLVVDASGRGEPTCHLLQRLALHAPEETKVGVDITTSAVDVTIPDAAAHNWNFVLTLARPPTLKLSAVMIPREENRWSLAVAQRGACVKPETWQDFLELLCRLNTMTLYDALRHADPPKRIRHFSFRSSVWRHFEKLPCLPRGVLPIGDALCRINPVYGQGMSSAARQARLLQDVLGRVAGAPDAIAAAQSGFMAEVGSLLQSPWNMSANSDFAFPETRGVRPENFLEAQVFQAALFRAVVIDPAVHRAVTYVSQQLLPQSVLREPDILARISAAATSDAWPLVPFPESWNGAL
jgi:2-polyprenyl-6-methoxyphenol hydroxylase-like FAD-dependent oxidoreductase